jgi:hypothetical protein
VSGTRLVMCVRRRYDEGVFERGRMRVYDGVFRRPLQLDGPSRPSLLLGARVSAELVCMSYVTGVLGEGRW